MKNPSYIEQSFSPYVFYRTRKVYISPSLLSVVFYAKCPLHLNITNAKNRSILMEWSPRIRFRKRRRFYLLSTCPDSYSFSWDTYARTLFPYFIHISSFIIAVSRRWNPWLYAFYSLASRTTKITHARTNESKRKIEKNRNASHIKNIGSWNPVKSKA